MCSWAVPDDYLSLKKVGSVKNYPQFWEIITLPVMLWLDSAFSQSFFFNERRWIQQKVKFDPCLDEASPSHLVTLIFFEMSSGLQTLPQLSSNLSRFPLEFYQL